MKKYRVRDIHLEDDIWKATLTTWEGCCSNLQIQTVSLEQKKRPTSKDFIKHHKTSVSLMDS